MSPWFIPAARLWALKPLPGKSQFGFYYGGNYFAAQCLPGRDLTPVTKPFIGFGGLNSPNSANRAIQEGTIDWTQTFWKNPQYGAVLMVTQFST